MARHFFFAAGDDRASNLRLRNRFTVLLPPIQDQFSIKAGRLVILVLCHFGAYLSLLPFRCAADDDAAPQVDCHLELKGHGEDVEVLAFHPSGRELFSGGHDARVIRWNFNGIVSRGASLGVPSAYWEIDRRKLGDRITSLAFDQSGRFAAVSGGTRWGNGYGSALQLFTPFRKDPYKFGAAAKWSYSCVALHPQGQFMVMGALNRELRVVSLLPKRGKENKPEPNLESRNAVRVPDEVWRVAYHPNGRAFVAGGRHGWLNAYKVTVDGPERIVDREFTQFPSNVGVTGLAFSPDGETLLACGSDGTVRVVRFASGTLLREWKPVDAKANFLCVHNRKPWILIAYQDRIARLIDFERGKLTAELHGHSEPIRAVAFHPNGRWAATGGNDHAVRIWDFADQLNSDKLAIRNERFKPERAAVSLNPIKEELPTDWKTLVGDGNVSTTLTVGDSFSVKQGVLSRELTSGRQTDIVTTKEIFNSFQLRMRYRVPTGATARLFWARPDCDRLSEEGYSLHLVTEKKHPGFWFGHTEAKSASRETLFSNDQLILETDRWHDLDVRVTSDRVQISIDEVELPDLGSMKIEPGKIAVRTWMSGLEIEKLEIRSIEH